MKPGRSPWALWCGCLLMLFVLSLPMPALHTQGSSPGLGYGMNIASTQGIQQTAQMGFEWVRIYFPDQVDEAKRRGLKVLLLLGWEAPLTNIQAWGDYVESIVHRYRGQVDAYQIANEPNLAKMWHQPKHADPAEYVAFLREAYLRAKAVDPNCIIVSAGLAVNGGMGDQAMDDVKFLRGMYAAGAKAYFDALGSHPYGFAYAPEDATSNPIHCFRRVEAQRAVMVQHGDGAKPIWLTEFGWVIKPPDWCYEHDGWDGRWWQAVSAHTQADYLVRAYRFARMNWPWMGVMFVWNMDYSLVPWNEYCDQLGWFAILNHDGNPRPAYVELARMAQGEPTPPATTPTSTRTSMPGSGTVAGRVLLQGRNDHHGALTSVGSYTATTDHNGDFRIEGAPTGAQELHAEMAGYLRQVHTLEIAAGRTVTLPDVQLRAGDINQDDTVDLFDLVAVSSRYGLQGPAYVEDLNADGEVNLYDLVLVSANYGTGFHDAP
jgi:hypothetical protein